MLGPPDARADARADDGHADEDAGAGAHAAAHACADDAAADAGPDAAARACVEIKISRRVRAESARRPPRRRRGVCSMAWGCRFLNARQSQHDRAVAEKRLSGIIGSTSRLTCLISAQAHAVPDTAADTVPDAAADSVPDACSDASTSA